MRWYCIYILLTISFSASSQELPPDTTQVHQLIMLGKNHQWKDLYSALDYADQALKLSQEINFQRGVAIANNLKGFCYWGFGDNELAIQSAHDALTALGDNHDRPIEADSYSVISRGYMDLRENKKALEYVAMSQTLAERGHDSTQLCNIYNLRGVLMFNIKKVDSALYYYNKAYAIGQGKSVDPINLPRVISNIGECYRESNPPLAFEHYTKALALAKQTGNKVAEASITAIIGHAYLRKKDVKNAEINLQSALDLASNLGLRRVVRHAYGGLVDIKLAQGNGDKAVIYLRRYYAVRDSLLNTSKIRQIVELEAKHELQLREKNIELLEKEKRIQTIWKNLAIGFALLLIIASGVVIRWQRFRYRKNREMLNLEIDYLTTQHKEAVDKYRRLQSPEAEDDIVSADQRLLKQAIEIVEANIGDSQMSVEKMAEALNMSRTSLHRKIKSITGFPPSELIRSIRLRKAARLIAHKADSPTQVAHAVGFEDYSHFSKVFKKHFGVSPSEYPELVSQEQV
ncbi:MAG: helix-turn-helix domain-containing protein [Bacteroidota bacterium]